MQKLINNHKQGFLQKVAIKKTVCHKKSFFVIRNNRLFQWSRIYFYLTRSFFSKKRWFLAINGSLSCFKQDIANKNTQDAYYSETSLSDTGWKIRIPQQRPKLPPPPPPPPLLPSLENYEIYKILNPITSIFF